MRSICPRWLSGAVLLTVLAHPAAAGIDRWTSIGPEGGSVVSLAAAPDAPATLYVGTSGGGVWKSLDGGGSWSPTPDGLTSTPVTSLAVTSRGVVAGHYYSLYFLAEGAAAWRQVGPFPYDVKGLAVDPERPELVWAAGDLGGMLLSEDGGEHWKAKLRLSGSFSAVAIAPTSPPTVYASGAEGIFASTDVGTTWRQLTPVFEHGRAWELDIDPEDPSVVYASAEYSGLFWKSTDAGAHWSSATQFAPHRTLALPGALLGGSGNFLARSEDRGETWRQVELPWSGEVDVLEADRAAPDGAWLSVRGGGLFHTLDGGQTWIRSGRQGLRASNIQAFSFDPFRPGTLYAATPETKLQRSVDGGASWSRMPTLLEARSLAADPKRSGTLYAGTPRGVSISRDRGLTWTRVLQEPSGIDAVVVDPRRPGTVWAGGYKLWRSRDGGSTWTRIKRPPGSSGPAAARRIYLSPWHPDTLYYIDFYLDGFDRPGSLWRSTDDGKTWQVIGSSSEPVALAFDPVTPDLLYVADYLGEIRRSRDGGTTWEVVIASLGEYVRLTALLVDRLDPSILYAGSGGFFGNAVWRSLDQGATWEPFSAGLPGPAITCLEAYARNPRRLIACTSGGGLQEMRISSGS